ncbi:MAG: hypothetical protein EAX86_07710 [Candidatus Heimdallarchaeota archaeon]|nr:hypothetical protein [Candidatus Heimdallarchaeota archaeon]
MGQNLEDQMRLSLRAILSKQMLTGEGKHKVISSFVSDENGFPLTGLKRREGSIVDMEAVEFEQLSAILPQIWENASTSPLGLNFADIVDGEVNHITIGIRDKGTGDPYLEIMITKLDELFLTSIYEAKKGR